MDCIQMNQAIQTELESDALLSCTLTQWWPNGLPGVGKSIVQYKKDPNGADYIWANVTFDYDPYFRGPVHVVKGLTHAQFTMWYKWMGSPQDFGTWPTLVATVCTDITPGNKPPMYVLTGTEVPYSGDGDFTPPEGPFPATTVLTLQKTGTWTAFMEALDKNARLTASILDIWRP